MTPRLETDDKRRPWCPPRAFFVGRGAGGRVPGNCRGGSCTFCAVRRLLPLFAISLTLVACDSGDKPKDEGGDKKEAAKPKPKPFEGELTVALIEGMGRESKERPSPFDPWEDAFANVQAKLGTPTKVDGKDHHWAVVEGDKCAYFTLEKDGDKVGIVDGPGTIDKAMKSMHDECIVKSGGEPPSAKIDPNAPQPPTDGSAVKPTVLRAGVAGAAPNWIGRTVTLEGTYFSTSTSSATGSDQKTVILSIVDSKDAHDESVGCRLVDGLEPPKATQYDPIRVSGKVSDTFGGYLEDCKVEAAAPEAADGGGDAAPAEEGADADAKADEAPPADAPPADAKAADAKADG